MVAGPALTTALQRQVLLLEDDIRQRVEGDPAARGRWVIEHTRAIERGRTAAAWETWRDDRVTQAAVGWVLTTVFVRFCEDNRLLRPVWIAGPEARRQEALDAELDFYRARSAAGADVTARDWLLQAVEHLARVPAMREIVGPHAALHLAAPSGDAAAALLAFWRERTDEGRLRWDLTDSALSTRFLGDLYQDLSQHAKDTYALLQTPEFVEEFLLDRTLEPALAERPLEGFRLLDPTCGSGHFLLGAFARFLDRWSREAPAMETQARVQQALDSVFGVDLNPFAVAIARFRLTVAALVASGLRSLEDAPGFRLNLAVGDSLLHGSDQLELDLGTAYDADAGLSGFTYATEDLALLRQILRPGTYDAVVGNPPYITVKDKQLNAAYRQRYSTCKGTYALTVPFMERFFGLARRDGARPAGWVGQITSNSFMKREFGSKLIEEFLARQDLRLVADTSGAYIPGHGTPTVILVGRPAAPVGDTVRAVLGVRGEPGRPDDAAKGIVWRSMVEHVDEPGWDDGWVTVADLPRGMLATHPWSLSGGGTGHLRSLLQDRQTPLQRRIELPIGRAVRAGADEAFVRPPSWTPRRAAADALRGFVTGEDLRDWAGRSSVRILYPYRWGTSVVRQNGFGEELWTWRAVLRARGTFAGDMQAAGLMWWEYQQHTVSAYTRPLSITFGEVATHNHFVLDRGGKVFKQTAPVIKLPEDASEDEHLDLLGVLNSSTACFWLKQVSDLRKYVSDHR